MHPDLGLYCIMQHLLVTILKKLIRQVQSYIFPMRRWHDSMFELKKCVSTQLEHSFVILIYIYLSLPAKESRTAMMDGLIPRASRTWQRYQEPDRYHKWKVKSCQLYFWAEKYAKKFVVPVRDNKTYIGPNRRKLCAFPSSFLFSGRFKVMIAHSIRRKEHDACSI
jgi:hypothetical protein